MQLYYYDQNGKKTPVSPTELIALVKSGVVTPDTIIENEKGKKVPAKQVKGLTFPTPEEKRKENPAPERPGAAPQAEKNTSASVAEKTPTPERQPLEAAATVENAIEKSETVVVPPLQAPTQCLFCGQELAPGQKFCSKCGVPAGTQAQCRSCGYTLEPGQKFCPECGAPFHRFTHCGACGHNLKANQKFCPNCGVRVGSQEGQSDLQFARCPNKTTATILAFLFGFLGIHRFYLGSAIGVIHLILFLVSAGVAAMSTFDSPDIAFISAIPVGILQLVDFLWLLCMSKEEFVKKFGRK